MCFKPPLTLAYQANGKYGKMFSKVEGKLWVDKQDFGWIKVDGLVIQPFSIGLFLVRVLRSSHIRMKQTRVGDGIWMPEHIEMNLHDPGRTDGRPGNTGMKTVLIADDGSRSPSRTSLTGGGSDLMNIAVSLRA